ncbi:electron transport complex subunit RsxC [Marinicella sp. S1101]|uniref:electron transport complex subunit RsxC n=1 Tax=Marinicella marina TaxID=2996016 RepID=UPI002260DAC0|nr:electron transport complex subunit RsxC [Marinicella marina]MCX7552661.1 electron transport complex subunit RsxC [Marinicella marina]MDJ1139537.1 electron transport complex subunit RsxC [Marinicella marina]
MNQDRLSHFHGGLVLRHHKKASCEKPMLPAGLPEQLVIAIKSSRGHTSEPVVAIGDHVFKGQVIAEPEDSLGTVYHAPTSGLVVAIEERQTASAEAKQAVCVVIEPDGEDTWLTRPEKLKLPASAQEIIAQISAAGIVGMGGAGFPTHIKYHATQTDTAPTLIINGAECEPYISCDERLMLDEPEAIVRGTVWLLKAAQANRAIIAIEDNIGGVKKQLDAAIKKLELVAQGFDLSVIKVPTIYPTGGEKQLIKVLTGIEVPSGLTPLSVGLIMQNVATAKAVYDAIELRKPLISRVITVTGDAIESPRNYEALIGTPFQHLLQLAACDFQDLDKLIIGGPMMGYAMPHADIGIEKTTNCLLALPADCTKPEIDAMPCIRCGDCVKVCPQELLPQQLLWYINGNDEHNDLEKAREHHVFDCIECGACSWVCPSHINLVDFYRFAKSELTYLDHKKAKAQQAKIRHDEREARLERIKAERQAKRRRKTAKLSNKKDAKAEMSAVLARIKQQEQAKVDDEG